MLQAGYTTRSSSDGRSVTNRLRHDEAWRIAADETGWTSTQIDCVLDRIAFR